MRPVKQTKHVLTFLLVRVLFFALNRMGRQAGMLMGSLLGVLAWRMLARDRYRIDRHLRLTVGCRMTPDERRSLSRRFFVNSGRNLIEVIRMGRHFERDIEPRLEFEGLEHLDAAYHRGRGVIAITGHIGNFELLAAAVSRRGYRCAAIGRTMYDRRMDQLLIDNRRRLGLTNFASTESPRKMLSWLKEGGILGVLIDVDSISLRSTFVPVLGRMALTPIGQTMLGLKAGAAFVPVACVRVRGDRYRVIFRPEITLEPSGDFDLDVYRMTAACSRELDFYIRSFPDQWIWLKNRWLTPLSYPAWRPEEVSAH
ncbi:MAG: lysophospholipid acyltransferase family protein [bacterium]